MNASARQVETDGTYLAERSVCCQVLEKTMEAVAHFKAGDAFSAHLSLQLAKGHLDALLQGEQV
jgi:hypothetical protein